MNYYNIYNLDKYNYNYFTYISLLYNLDTNINYSIGIGIEK